MGIGGKGKRRVGQREDRPAVHGAVAVLVPAGNPQPDFRPAAETSISSIPASCAQASFKKNGSGVFMEGITTGVYGVVQRRRLRGRIVRECRIGEEFSGSFRVVCHIIASGSKVGDRKPAPALPDLCPFPDHGAYITAHHFAKAEQEPLLDTPRELVFGDRGEPECLVKRDQDDG